ncbi:TetR/AcrR family transcriptional regulator [Saccharopolyspora phatthalungensis]|uniref:AcrR family transcriptional regulator n=1 Tax=Saccharopolyspora phatthalungensis TaxID=664693 RepID=A0A840QK15_9PSEU|nr:TetR/AcrR family transcriptional regulator [Saccharopolyspora phatthalungensis]MBB5159838.1 AcrR family transcriptional regulator [Saccharopolyspora phatthalungensis]
MTRPASSPNKRSAPRGSGPADVSHDDVVRVALELAAANGLDALSIRGVASTLGISPMSIYRFVASKDELLDAMVLKVLDRMEIPYIAATDWRERIVKTMLAWRDLIEDQPGVVQILINRRMPAGSPGLGRLAEQVLAALEHGGITGTAAARAFWHIFSFTFGHIIFERARSQIDDQHQADARDDMHQTARDHGFAHVAELATQLTQIDARGRLDDALRVLLVGLTHPAEQ